MNNCSSCEGSGTVTCPTCGGEGLKYFVPILDIWESGCSACYGLGTVLCPDCAPAGQHALHLANQPQSRPTVSIEAHA